jgi:hypothetical protein
MVTLFDSNKFAEKIDTVGEVWPLIATNLPFESAMRICHANLLRSLTWSVRKLEQ